MWDLWEHRWQFGKLSFDEKDTHLQLRLYLDTTSPIPLFNGEKLGNISEIFFAILDFDCPLMPREKKASCRKCARITGSFPLWEKEMSP